MIMWLVVVVLVGIATVADVETSFAALARSPNAREGNPILRPFMRNRVTAYAAQIVPAGVLLYLAKRGGAWYIPSVALVLAHGFGVWSNTRVGKP